jgi:hypothetical protein
MIKVDSHKLFHPGSYGSGGRNRNSGGPHGNFIGDRPISFRVIQWAAQNQFGGWKHSSPHMKIGFCYAQNYDGLSDGLIKGGVDGWKFSSPPIKIGFCDAKNSETIFVKRHDRFTKIVSVNFIYKN